MHKAVHPRDDIDWLDVSSNEGGRGLTSIDDCIDTRIQRLEDYIKKYKEIYTVASNSIHDIRTDKNKTNKQKQTKTNNKN